LAAKAKVQLRIIFAPAAIGCSVELTDCFAQQGCSQLVPVFVASFADQEMAQRGRAGQMLGTQRKSSRIKNIESLIAVSTNDDGAALGIKPLAGGYPAQTIIDDYNELEFQCCLQRDRLK